MYSAIPWAWGILPLHNRTGQSNPGTSNSGTWRLRPKSQSTTLSYRDDATVRSLRFPARPRTLLLSSLQTIGTGQRRPGLLHIQKPKPQASSILWLLWSNWFSLVCNLHNQTSWCQTIKTMHNFVATPYQLKNNHSDWLWLTHVLLSMQTLCRLQYHSNSKHPQHLPHSIMVNCIMSLFQINKCAFHTFFLHTCLRGALYMLPTISHWSFSIAHSVSSLILLINTLQCYVCMQFTNHTRFIMLSFKSAMGSSQLIYFNNCHWWLIIFWP